MTAPHEFSRSNFTSWLASPERASLTNIAYELRLNESDILLGDEISSTCDEESKYKLLLARGPAPFELLDICGEINGSSAFVAALHRCLDDYPEARARINRIVRHQKMYQEMDALSKRTMRYRNMCREVGAPRRRIREPSMRE